MMFEWDGQKEKAAVLLGLGELTIAEIAKDLDVAERTVYRWQTDSEFQARVDENREAIRKEVLRVGITNQVNRLKRLDKRWRQIDQLITERGREMDGDVAGGGTGLLAHDKKSIGSGDSAYEVDVYRADVALLKEERELAKQAAIEIGQWQEKTDVTSGGQPFKALIGINVDDI